VTGSNLVAHTKYKSWLFHAHNFWQNNRYTNMQKKNIEDYSGERRQDSGSKLGPLHPEGLSSANSATCARCLLQITEI